MVSPGNTSNIEHENVSLRFCKNKDIYLRLSESFLLSHQLETGITWRPAIKDSQSKQSPANFPNQGEKTCVVSSLPESFGRAIPQPFSSLEKLNIYILIRKKIF